MKIVEPFVTYLAVAVVLVKRDWARGFRHLCLVFNFCINQPEKRVDMLRKMPVC